MTKETGGQAFPGITKNQPRLVDGIEMWEVPQGMTLRDYFAGQALAGIMSNYKDIITFAKSCYGKDSKGLQALSNMAYQHADTMIAERNK